MGSDLASFDHDYKLLAVTLMLKTKLIVIDSMAETPSVAQLLDAADKVDHAPFKSFLLNLLRPVA